jgi:hypothetical protein
MPLHARSSRISHGHDAYRRGRPFRHIDADVLADIIAHSREVETIW